MFENGKKYFELTNYGESDFWKWIGGVALIIVAFVVGQLVASVFIIGKMFSNDPNALEKFSQDSATLNSELMAMIGNSPFLYGLMLASFSIPFIMTLVVVAKLHKRFFRTVLTAAEKFRWKRLVFAAVLTFFVAGGFAAIGHYSGTSPLKFTFNPNTFLIFALISLLFIPVQSAAEEIVVRGYFNQWLGHFLSNKWIVFAITSALFASLHLANPESTSSANDGQLEHLMIMGSYFLFGFLLCIIVYFEGGLEAVIGVHIANNLFAATLVNYEGSVLPTPSLFLSGKPDGQGSLTAILIYMGIVGAILYFTRRKNLEKLDASQITSMPDVQRL